VFSVRGLDHLVLRVRDLEASLRFYRDALGLAVESLGEYRAGSRPFVSVRAGDQLVDLVPDPHYDPQAGTKTRGLLHFCLLVEGDLAEVIARLKAQGAEVIEERPVQRLGARGLGPSLYVRDPDGYVVELKAA